jgi:hypothetical protein
MTDIKDLMRRIDRYFEVELEPGIVYICYERTA